MAECAEADKRWIVFVMGPTACGKSVTAEFLARQLDAKFIEGDDFHPKANVEKMSRGEALTDEDRWGWLQALSEHAAVHLRGPGTHHLIVTCSALKREYRELLRHGAREAGDLRLLFVFLDVPEAELVRRADARQHHFARSSLVRSQMATLERPDPQTEPDVIVVDGNRAIELVEQDSLAAVKKTWGI